MYLNQSSVNQLNQPSAAYQAAMQAISARLAELLPPEEIPQPPQYTAANILTPMQVEGLRIEQALCRQIIKAAQQINTTSITYELGFGRLLAFEAIQRLDEIDKRIAVARIAARRLGVKSVLPKVKLAPPKVHPIEREAA